MPWKTLEKAMLLLISVGAAAVLAVVAGASLTRWWFPDQTNMPPPTPYVTKPMEAALATPSSTLFGAATSDLAAIKKTQLKWVLKGVFPTEYPHQGMAVIALANGQEALYETGDRLWDDVSLIAVYPDYIVIERNGSQESLYFAEQADANDTLLVTKDSDVDTSLPLPSLDQIEASTPTIRADLSEQWPQYVQQFQEQPEALLNKLGVTQTDQGYQLNDKFSASQLGLKAGDTIISINGQAIGSGQPDPELLQSLKSSPDIRLEVERGNQRVFINFSIK